MVEGLSSTERGIVLGAILGGEGGEGGVEAARALSHIVGAEACQRAARKLKALDGSTRRQRVAELVRELTAPLPEGLALIHPSWVAACLETASAALRPLLLSVLPRAIQAQLGGPVGAPAARLDATLRWRLCQHVFAPLTPMVHQRSAPWLEWSAARLSAALIQLGCAALAQAARRAGAQALAQLRERLAPTHTACFDRALAAELSPLPAIPRTGLRQQGDPERLLLSLGAALVGGALPPARARALAQRLPRDRGGALLGADALPPDQAQQVLDGFTRADRLAREQTEAR